MTTDLNNGRGIALNQAYANFEKALDDAGADNDARRAGTMGFIDGHKAGYRAAAGANYIALGVILEANWDDVASYRDAIAQLREAVKENGR